MIDLTRVQSGFDAELMIGKEWLLTAIQALQENGVIELPLNMTIADVEIIDDQDWDLRISTNLGITELARMTINNGMFRFETGTTNEVFEIPMPTFGQLAATPVLKKVLGSNGYENAMALLINLGIRASAQGGDPLAAGEHLQRGFPDSTVSFLPEGQHIALGIPRVSFERFANNIWHTELRDVDGSHPLPKPGMDKKGKWKRVKTGVSQKRIKFTIKGEVPIDWWPDADVDLEIILKPKLVDGKLTFSLDTDLDVDTGFWGDVLAFTIGALAALTIGLLSGGALLIPAVATGIGAVVFLEVGEYVAGEIFERMLTASDSRGRRIAGKMCDDHVVKVIVPKPPDDGFSIGLLDALPTSIPIFVDQDDPLFTKTVTVKANFDEKEMNRHGLAVAGKSSIGEVFNPKVARLVESEYLNEELKSLKYIKSGGEEVELSLEEVLDRLSTNDLKPPLKYFTVMGGVDLKLPYGKLITACLTPTHIKREKTVIKRIKFNSGLELDTQDAIKLQDNAGIYLWGLELIHPVDGNPYFRAPANESTDDNFEELPEF